MFEFIKNLFKKKLSAATLNNFRRSHQIKFDDLCKQVEMGKILIGGQDEEPPDPNGK